MRKPSDGNVYVLENGPSHVGTKWKRDSNPLLDPINPQKFLHKGSRAYSISSSAVNLNRWLRFQGFAVPPVTWGIHYNTRSILYLLQRVAGIPATTMDWMVQKNDGSTAYVEALRHCIDARSADDLNRLKSTLCAESMESFATADCLLITLGLSAFCGVEIDGQLVTLNRAPYRNTRSLAGVSPEITNRLPSVEECAEDICEIVELIQAHKPPGTPIAITISPVPLKHSSSDCHPHVACSRSNSNSCFPSFEFFQTIPKIETRQAGGLHPTAPAHRHRRGNLRSGILERGHRDQACLLGAAVRVAKTL